LGVVKTSTKVATAEYQPAAGLVQEGLDLNWLDAAGTPSPQRQTATA